MFHFVSISIDRFCSCLSQSSVIYFPLICSCCCLLFCGPLGLACCCFVLHWMVVGIVHDVEACDLMHFWFAIAARAHTHTHWRSDFQPFPLFNRRSSYTHTHVVDVVNARFSGYSHCDVWPSIYSCCWPMVFFFLRPSFAVHLNSIINHMISIFSV